jgi:hypothetical protein
MSTGVLSPRGHIPTTKLDLDEMITRTLRYVGAATPTGEAAFALLSNKSAGAPAGINKPVGAEKKKLGSKRRKRKRDASQDTQDAYAESVKRVSIGLSLIAAKPEGSSSPFVRLESSCPEEPPVMKGALHVLENIMGSASGKRDAPSGGILPDLPTSGFSHECDLLRWGGPLPTCSNGSDCVVRSLGTVAAANGPLPAFISMELKDKMNREGYEAIRPTIEASQPRFCVLCWRHLAQKAKLAHEAVGDCGVGIISMPYTNLCDRPDGYVRSAMGITPDDMFVSGSPHMVSATIDLRVKYDPLVSDRPWYVEQDPACIYRSQSSCQ